MMEDFKDFERNWRIFWTLGRLFKLSKYRGF